jgi:Domain of unknown function (DUF4124)
MSRSLMRSALLPAIALFLGLSASAMAADVYKWKDANGVTHYSESPPPKGSAEYRMYLYAKREGAKTAVSAEANQCTTARSNVSLLESGKPLRRDTDGDGKPDADLSDKDRAQQLELAKMVLRANCPAQPAAKATPKP